MLAGMGRGEEVRVNTLFRLWTIYFWLTSQFSTVLEIRVSQNLAKLGGGGAHKGWKDRREMK